MTEDPPQGGHMAVPRSEADDQSFDVVKTAAGLVAGAIVISALYLGQGILIPLAIAFLISFALGPLVSWLSRAGVNRVLAITLVMASVLAVIAALTLVVVTQVQTLSSDLPKYQQTIRGKLEEIKKPGMLDRALSAAGSLQKEVTSVVSSDDEALPPSRVEVVTPASSQLDTAVAWLSPVLTGLATTGIVFVFVFLVLLDRGDLRDRLLRLLGGNLHRSTDTLEEAGSRISRYLLMQLVVNVSYGVPLALGLWMIGVPGWILWGVLGAVMRFIPYLGPLLSAIFPLSLAFAVDPGWEMVLWTLALIGLLELISNNIVEPLLYGSSTGLSALSLIAAATFWTALWGPVGLILSTPLTVCLLVIGKNLPQLQFLDALLGSTPVLDVPTRIYQRLLADDPEEAVEIAEAEIEKTSIVDFYNDHAIDVLRLVSDDYHRHSRAAHRLRVANGMDDLLDAIRAEHPAPAADLPPRVACIGGKWEIDGVACEILSHALTLEGVPTIQPRAGVITPRELQKLDLTGIEILLLSFFTTTPEASVRNFTRRLRQLHPKIQIILVLWSPNEDLLENKGYGALGAHGAVASVQEAVLKLRRILHPEEILAAQVAAAPENDEARVTALMQTDVLTGEAREDLDALAKRAADVFNVKFAVISAINTDTEFIVGQSIELPGHRDANDMITMPRSEAICDHVVSEGETLVVPDTERDPVFADHPAIKLWKTRFYAGAPLKTADGLVLGALCLLDVVPRDLEEDEVELLETLAADVVERMTGELGAEGGTEEKSKSSASVGQIIPH